MEASDLRRGVRHIVSRAIGLPDTPPRRSSDRHGPVRKDAPRPRLRLRSGVALALVLSVGVAFGLTTRAASPPPRIAPTATVQLGAKPLWVAVHPTLERAYVTNSQDGTVSVIDLAQRRVLTEIAVGPAPTIVAVDPAIDRAYVSDFEDQTVWVIDLLENEVVAVLPVGGLGLAVDPVSHRVYAAGGFDIAVIDGTTAEVVTTFAAPEGANVWGLVFDGRSGRLFATDLDRPRVLALDAASGALVGEIALAAPARFAIALDEAARRLYVATDVQTGAELVTADADRLRPLASAPAPAVAFGIAAGPAGRVFVGAPRAAEVAEVTTPEGTRLSTLATGRTARGVAFHKGTVLVIDHHDEILGIRGQLLFFEPPAPGGN